VTRKAAESSAEPTVNETADPAVRQAGVTPDSSAGGADGAKATAATAVPAPGQAPDPATAPNRETPLWNHAVGDVVDPSGDASTDAWVAAVAPETATKPGPAVALDQETPPASIAPAPIVAVDQPPRSRKPRLGLEDAPAILKLVGITRRRGDAAAIEGFDLDVRPGEGAGRLAGNGQDKTTVVDSNAAD